MSLLLTRLPKFASSFIRPDVQTPLMKEMMNDITSAEIARNLQLEDAVKFVAERITPFTGGKGTEISKLAARIVEGEVPREGANKAAVIAADAYDVLKNDFAKRLDIPQWKYYLTRKTDMETVFSAFKEQFSNMESMSDLPPGLLLKVPDADEFTRWKTIFSKYSNYLDMPTLLRKQTRDQMFFSRGVSKWESLPDFIKDRLPEEVFSPYLLERKGGVPYIQDVHEAIESYVPGMLHKINFDPVVTKWKDKVAELEQLTSTSRHTPLTEQHAINRHIDVRVLGEPTTDRLAVNSLLNYVNAPLEKELLSPERLDAGITLFRSANYRGLIGLSLDTATLNSTQSLLTWAEHGRIVGPIMKFVQNNAKTKELSRFFGEFVPEAIEADHFRRIGDPAVRKVLEVDRFLNEKMLYPMTMTEFMNKGIAFWAAAEEGLSKGLTFNKVLINADAAMSDVLVNPKMEEAYLYALQRIARTQFGGSQLHKPAALAGPLGRLSSIFTDYTVSAMALVGRELLTGSAKVAAEMKMRGFENGLAEAMRTGDAQRLLRFMTVTGVAFGLGSVLGKIGADVRNQFSPGGLLNNLTLPFFQMVYNGYNAVLGENAVKQDVAQRQFQRYWDDVLSPVSSLFSKDANPVGRYGRKVTNVIENVQRGYAVDRHGRFIYESTTAGELMRLLGIGPENAYDNRQLALQLSNMSLEHSVDKRKALDALLLEGDVGAVQKYQQKWGLPITNEDILGALKQQMTTPQERAAKGLPKALRP